MIWLVAAGAAVADEHAQEFWPEVDLWWRISPDWRVSMLVPISQNIETDYREGSLILQGDYSFWKGTRRYSTRLMDENRAQDMNALMVRGGYLGGESLGDRGEAYTERTIFSEFHLRIPIIGGVLLQHRLRNDLRWLGEARDFSTRWRYRLQAEREFEAGRTSVVPYASVEPYYDSRHDSVSRVRMITGASVAWSPRFALEGNMTYQYDSQSSTRHLCALNVILHVYFETYRVKQHGNGDQLQGRVH
jgi:hypothetical protein